MSGQRPSSPSSATPPGAPAQERRKGEQLFNFKKRRLVDIDVRQERDRVSQTSSDLIVRRLGAFMSYVTLEPRERAEIVVLTEELVSRLREDGPRDLAMMGQSIVKKLHTVGATGDLPMNEIRDDYWNLVVRFREHYG
jgi:hypothetical protein